MDPAVFAPRSRGARPTGPRFGVGPGDLLVTYIGRIAREKNLGLLLEAWETLAPERGGAQLVLVGRGPLEDEIRRREIPGVHVTGLLQGRGAVRRPTPPPTSSPFPPPTETFGNSLLEAMGSGLPSLVAAGGRSPRVRRARPERLAGGSPTARRRDHRRPPAGSSPMPPSGAGCRGCPRRPRRSGGWDRGVRSAASPTTGPRPRRGPCRARVARPGPSRSAGSGRPPRRSPRSSGS